MDPIKKVSLIGAGNLATNLSLSLIQKDIEIAQVYSKSLINAELLAAKTKSEPTDNLRNLRGDVDLIILSVTDNAYSEVIDQIVFRNVPIVHTAGSLSLGIFQNRFPQYGVFYPFQSFSKERVISFKNIPICIEANRKELTDNLFKLGGLLSDQITELTSEQRKKLHLCGIISNNFSNFLFTLAGEYLEKEGMKFDMLLPLLEETLEKLKFLSPKDAQTGPAVRGNKNIIEKHKEMLKDEPQLLNVYSLLSENILEFYGKM